MDKENTMSKEDAEEIVTIVNVVTDIMENKELGTTTDGNMHIASIVEEMVKEDKQIKYAKLEDLHIKMNTGVCAFGYNTYGIEFIERLIKNNPEYAVSVIYSLLKQVGGEDIE